MGGGRTEIDTGEVSRSGIVYTGVGSTMAHHSGALKEPGITVAQFGRAYASSGESYLRALRSLSEAIGRWSGGANAVGTGLTASANGHRQVDTSSANSMRAAGRG